MSDNEEIAALKQQMAEQKAEIEALKAAQPKPAPEPFRPKPYEPIDWTARMSMPRSAIEAMVAAEPKGFMAGVVSDNRGPTSPSSAVPRSQQVTGDQGSGASAGSGGSGWRDATPIGPPPGIGWVDAQLIADDVKQRSKDKR